MISENIDKTILVTGCCGFIGFHVCQKLKCKIIGVDNMNYYYDIRLKTSRLKILNKKENFIFLKQDISNYNEMQDIFKRYKIDIVINLAAQAGVRYSIENPDVYIQSNIIGFYNIISLCKDFKIKHLIYASSSSVYGNNEIPFKETDNVDKPISLYAATKKSNELIAHVYSHLYNLPTTGLRFFTVYGPYGRPDMSYFSFAEKMLNNDCIQLYNWGNNKRDFTYIDDIVQGILNILNYSDNTGYKIYNIGNNHPVRVLEFVNILYKKMKQYNLIKEYNNFSLIPKQAGDVDITYADINNLKNDFDFCPNTSLEDGLDKFVQWFKIYKGDKK